jgi:hypothetical protein
MEEKSTNLLQETGGRKGQKRNEATVRSRKTFFPLPFSASTASFIHISLLISTPLLVRLEMARAESITDFFYNVFQLPGVIPV